MNLKKEQWTLAKLNNDRDKISVVSDFVIEGIFRGPKAKGGF